MITASSPAATVMLPPNPSSMNVRLPRSMVLISTLEKSGRSPGPEGCCAGAVCCADEADAVSAATAAIIIAVILLLIPMSAPSGFIATIGDNTADGGLFCRGQARARRRAASPAHQEHATEQNRLAHRAIARGEVIGRHRWQALVDTSRAGGQQFGQLRDRLAILQMQQAVRLKVCE